MQETRTFWLGVLASSLASLGTLLGAAGVFLVRKPSDRMQDAMLSVAAGVMLAASFFSLLQPAIDAAWQFAAPRLLAASIVGAGLLSGMALMLALHQVVPHEHFVLGREGPRAVELQRMWLFVIAITLHNFPEGMAVGIGNAGAEFAKAVPLTLGIGLQNIPEGLAVALSLVAAGYARSTAFLTGCLTALVEPLGGAFGSAAAWLALPLMPFTLGFAAGAMLFIINDEVIPETHRRGYENTATIWLMVGFAAMMVLDAGLG